MDTDKTSSANSGNKEAEYSANIAGSGFLLFLSTLVISVGGWLYWVIISKFATSTEIGDATSVYSLITLAATLAQLGLEYPLLKRSVTQGSQILGTMLIIELTISASSLPLIYFIMANFYDVPIDLFWLGAGLITFSSLYFVSRYALLGLSETRTNLIINTIGTVVKIILGFALVSIGFGAFGIILSFMIQSLVTAAGTLVVARKHFQFTFGGIAFTKQIMWEGLLNLPSKISSVFIVSLSVVLLASFGIPSSEVGIFYVITMISIVAAGFASSTALMSIPASSAKRTDLSSNGERIGLAITAPIIAMFIAAPQPILSIIGNEYAGAFDILVILAIGMFPSILVRNAISKFNNQEESKKLATIGVTQCALYLIAFFLLAPHYGTTGAAYSIVIAFVGSSVFSLIWSDKRSFRYIAICALSIIAGASTSIMIGNLVLHDPIVSMILSFSLSLIIILGFKCISPKEILASMRNVGRPPTP